MDYNKKAHDEVVNLVQKFMQDYYQLRARQIKNPDKPAQKQISDEEHIDRNTNNPDKTS